MKRGVKIISLVLVVAIVIAALAISLTACNLFEFLKHQNEGGTQHIIEPLDNYDNKVLTTLAGYYWTVKERYKTRETCKDDMFWDDLFLYAYKDFSGSAINQIRNPRQSYLNSLQSVVIDEDLDYARYFHAMRLNRECFMEDNLDYDHGTNREFKEKYMAYLDSYDTSKINVNNAFECAPVLGLAKNSWIKQDSKHNDEAKKKVFSFIENKPLCKEKVDGSYKNAFMLNTLFAQNNTYTKEDLADFLKVKTYSNEGSITDYATDGLALMMYAACGINPRKAQKELGLEQDVIEYLVGQMTKIGAKPGGDPIMVILNDKGENVNAKVNDSISMLYVGLVAYRAQIAFGGKVQILAY